MKRLNKLPPLKLNNDPHPAPPSAQRPPHHHLRPKLVDPKATAGSYSTAMGVPSTQGVATCPSKKSTKLKIKSVKDASSMAISSLKKYQGTSTFLPMEKVKVYRFSTTQSLRLIKFILWNLRPSRVKSRRVI